MSDTPHQHQHEHCLNCGKALRGRYCSACGQDSEEHMDSIWHLVKHFFNDITHYDGKFWKTMSPLLLKPGYLTQEFLKGKRASYLNPVRLFIFLNFIFFLLITWLPSAHVQTEKKPVINIQVGDESFTVARYDSIQNSLATEKRDSRLERALIFKLGGIAEKAKTDPRFIHDGAEIFMHNAAYLTFLFLVFSSLLLGLLYFRKHLLMVHHALFSIHIACTFLLLSILMLLVSYLPLSDILVLLILIYGNFYFFRALRVVYGQSFFKTGLKFIFIELLMIIIMGTAVLANALIAFLSVKG